MLCAAHRSLLPCLLLLCACGAPDPLAGDWENETGSDDWTNEMSVGEELLGSVTLHYTMADTSHHSVFDLDAQNRDQGLYWIDLVCVEDCPDSGMDFRMTCDLDEAETTLSCEADGWYDLTWERVG